MKKTKSDKKTTGRKKRPFVGVIFKCCHIYARIYLNKKETAFVGWCPKCGAKMEIHISPTGSKSNFFIAE
jgi:hypothetical protein